MRYGNCLDGFLGHGMNYFGFGSYFFVGAVIVVVVVLLLMVFAHNKKRGNSISEAEEALKMRYVKGEITEEEYQKMKKMIQ